MMSFGLKLCIFSTCLSTLALVVNIIIICRKSKAIKVK